MTDPRNDRDHFYLTLGSPGTFGVGIKWEDLADDFNLIVYRGYIGPTTTPPPTAVVGRSGDNLGREVGTTRERVQIKDAEAGQYTVRVIYKMVIDSGYEGSASMLDGRASHHPVELEFGPATIVSAHFLGAEPMMTMERPILGSDLEAIDPDRIFVDWPLTARGQIGQVSRSLDGGKSFRLLFDPNCPERSRPGCLMGGGSDTITEVDLIDGTLYFSDQAALIGAESLASSTDHGDTFPENRQFAISSQVTATDRQWLAPVNGVPIEVDTLEGVRDVKAFLTYHVPLEGQYIHGIDQNGEPIAQAVPQIKRVLQSGFPRVDTSDGPGAGWIYQPYLNFGGTEGFQIVKVATARGRDYQDPAAWGEETTHATITGVTTISFAWLDIDTAGNAYVVWVTGNPADGSVTPAVYYSVSPIDDPRNDPRDGGRPGTFWTRQTRISPPEIQSTVFAEVVAGDEGRIAVSYLGTEEDFAEAPDNAFSGIDWHAYASVVTDALGENGPPVIHTGRVSHRAVHDGQICTGGTSCLGDRSLADMIDIGVDRDGRIGVVFADNNNSLPWQNEFEKARPFAHFAKLSSGPSLFADMPIVDVARPVDGTDENGDATWPNVASAGNLPGLDLLDADVSLEVDEIVARIALNDASSTALQQAFLSFKDTSTSIQPPNRLHYMVRFATAENVYHLSMESDANGTPKFFGGRLDNNDALRIGDSLVGAAYNRDQMAVTGSVEGNTLVIRGDATDFGVGEGTEVFSVTGFAMGGPAEEDVAVINPMRTVDATPPFDATLSPEPLPATLLYTGDVEGKVGSTAAVSARLATADGSPLAGQTISFSRGGKDGAAVTGLDGVAATTLHITGPPGSGLPIVVTFDGDASVLPVSIQVPFTAHTGSTKTGPPRGAI